jgi:hypothetical protein
VVLSKPENPAKCARANLEARPAERAAGGEVAGLAVEPGGRAPAIPIDPSRPTLTSRHRSAPAGSESHAGRAVPRGV